MQPDAVIRDLGRIDAQHGYSAGKVAVTVQRLDAAELEALLARDWSEASGWIARQSKVIARPREADDPGQGAVLELELAQPGASLQVRRLPGLWLATTVLEGRGEDCLTDEVVLVTVRDGAARYRRFWRLPSDGAVALIACRLVDFGRIF